jgi:hypothetical protein
MRVLLRITGPLFAVALGLLILTAPYGRAAPDHQPIEQGSRTPTPSITPVAQATQTLPSTCVTQSAAMSSSSIRAGERVTFTASGFAPSSDVQLRISGPTPTAQPQQQTVAADATCRAIATVETFVTDLPGSYTIQASGLAARGGTLDLTTTFTITADGLSPTPTAIRTSTPTPRIPSSAETPTGSTGGEPTGSTTGTATVVTATPTHIPKDPRTEDWPTLSADETKEVQSLIDQGKNQDALDKLVETMKKYCCNFFTMAGGAPTYDAGVSGEGSTERKKGGKVKIGPDAFSSAAWLYSSLKHEMVHSQQWQDPDAADKLGSNGREKEAYQREIDNAKNTGVSDADKKELEKRRAEY